MSCCPPEIWSDILRHLRLPSPKVPSNSSEQYVKEGDPHSAALVCTALSPIAQAELFRTAFIRNGRSGERLLDVLRWKPELGQCIKRVVFDGFWEEDMRLWFRTPQAHELLPHFRLVTNLILKVEYWRMESHMADAGEIEFICGHFLQVTHLKVELWEYGHVRDVCALIRSFGSNLYHIELANVRYGGLSGRFAMYAHQSGNYPALLDHDVLAKYTALNSLPHLGTFIQSNTVDLKVIEWLVRVGAADQVHTLWLTVERWGDYECAVCLLAHGCKALKRLVFDMNSVGWRKGPVHSMIKLNIPVHIKVLEFLEIYDVANLPVCQILARVPIRNALEGIMFGIVWRPHLQFENIARCLAQIDMELDTECLARVPCVRVRLSQLHESKTIADFISCMPQAQSRGVLEVSAAA